LWSTNTVGRKNHAVTTHYNVVNSTPQIKRAANLIRKYKLYIPSWLMSTWIEYPEDIKRIVICRSNKTPVGAGIIMKDLFMDSVPTVAIYIKVEYRRMGIGTDIMLRLLKNNKDKVRVACGVKGSQEFFKKCGKSERPIQILY
jgi:hypothetical protein